MAETIKSATIIRKIIIAGNSMKKLILSLALFGFCFSQQYDSQQPLKDISNNRLQQTIEKYKILTDKYSQNTKEVKYFFDIDEIAANLLSESGTRVLYVAVSLGVKKEDFLNVLSKIRPIITDVIIKIASNKTFEEISTLKGKEILSYEIAEAINKSINQMIAENNVDIIKCVFFNKFFVDFQDVGLKERIETIEELLKIKP